MHSASSYFSYFVVVFCIILSFHMRLLFGQFHPLVRSIYCPYYAKLYADAITVLARKRKRCAKVIHLEYLSHSGLRFSYIG